MTITVDWRDYDVIVVGSGGAGCAAAESAASEGARVLMVSKDPIGASDTKISEGSATVRESVTDDDTVEELASNLRASGADLNLPSITKAYAEDSREAYDWYRAHGLRPKINAERHGPYARPMAKGGHTMARSVPHRNAGVAFGHAGWQALIENKRIDYLEDAWFLDLVTDSTGARPRIVGGLIYDAANGAIVAARAPSVVIAAGGLSTLFFPKTDTMRGNTGDSYAIAARAGAELVDMEQVQFLPFCLTSPPSYEGLLIGEPSSASFLGVLRDKHGKVILTSVYMRTRAECSAAIMRAVADGRGSEYGGAYLDMTHNARLPKSGPYFQRFIQTALPTGYKTARQAMTREQIQCKEPWPVRPAAHYHMGGIRADANGASAGGPGEGKADQGLEGLFAAGQAMGGVFGANRLGSTALTENVVFGIRAGRGAAALARATAKQADQAAFAPTLDNHQKRFGQKGDRAAATLKQALQEAAWECIGPARTAESLTRMDTVVSEIAEGLDRVAIPGYGLWNQAFIEFQELRNLLDVARAVSAAARERDASLGGHVRLDRPNQSLFAKPYSTVVRRESLASDSYAYAVARLDRERTPALEKLAFEIKARWKKAKNNALRLLPDPIVDGILEKRYEKILGPNLAAKPITPGSPAGAVAEAGQQ